MWKALQNGWKPNQYYSKDEYLEVKNNFDKYEPHLIGWIGFNCSYKGHFFNGYSGISFTKYGKIRNYQAEALNAVIKQIDLMQSVTFLNYNYYDLEIPGGSIVYCDPPYKDTQSYKVELFDHNNFWDWVRFISKNNNVYISEYNAPNDFECIFSKQVSSRIRSNAKNKISLEKLFKFKG